MSTQQAPSIDFSVAQNFANFQLVELPDELVQLISNHKDSTPVLQLKSEAESGNAVLCSTNKTFPIRSVQTSNSLYVVRPAAANENDPSEIPSYGIQAISSCGATLELSKSGESALPYLRKALPEYSSRDLNISAAAKSSFDAVCSSIPFSDGEIRDTWVSLCAFEEHGASFRPTADVLLQLWKAIVTAAVVEDINITAAFLSEDLWKVIKDEDFPRGLYDALLRRIEDPNTMKDDDSSSWCSIDKTRCAELVAALILETQAVGDQAIQVDAFVDAWKGNLFENWSSDLSLDLVQKIVVQPVSDKIKLKPEHRLAPSRTAGQAPETKAPTKARKWHDKFKKGRT